MAAKRRRKKKNHHGFIPVLFAVIAAMVLFAFMSGIFFKITSVRVEGVTVYRSSDVAAKAGFVNGENIFLINKIAAVRAIRAAFPYVDSVRIRRELPGTVVVIIEEKAPAVMVELGGYYWYMDIEGVLLESVSIPLALSTLPVAKGVTLTAPVAGTGAAFGEKEADKLPVLLTLLSILQEKNMWQDVDWIDLSLLSNPSFSYLDRFTVLLGTPDHLEEKLAFMLAFQEEVEGSAKGTVDLSSAYDGNPARFRPE